MRGLVDLTLATVTALAAAAGALVAYGLATSAGNVTLPTLIQTRVSAELRGRMFAGFDVIWQMVRLASVLVGGVVAGHPRCPRSLLHRRRAAALSGATTAGAGERNANARARRSHPSMLDR